MKGNISAKKVSNSSNRLIPIHNSPIVKLSEINDGKNNTNIAERARDPYKSLGYSMIILSWKVRGMNDPNRTKKIKKIP